METSLSSQQPLEEAETQALKLLNREEVKGEGLAWEGLTAGSGLCFVCTGVRAGCDI